MWGANLDIGCLIERISDQAKSSVLGLAACSHKLILMHPHNPLCLTVNPTPLPEMLLLPTSPIDDNAAISNYVQIGRTRCITYPRLRTRLSEKLSFDCLILYE